MLIVGELINTSRKAIQEAVEKKDTDYIKKIAVEQAEAGAHYIDINCGTQIDDEPRIMEWLVNTVQAAVQNPLCIDTPNPEAMEVGLSLVKNNRPMINSISAEAHRYDKILTLVKKYQAKVIALCMDDKGIPQTADQRLEIIKQLVTSLADSGVELEDIFLDPLVKPVSVDSRAGVEVLEAINYIKTSYPEVHAICGLSNISFGLPQRKILNQTFMIQTMTVGMDAYILDPLDKAMMGFLYASQAVLGQDKYCNQFLKAFRNGMYK